MFALSLLEREGILDWGQAGTESEFFVIKLRDKHAHAALMAYAVDAMSTSAVYSEQVAFLAMRAGPGSSFCKKPD